MNNITQRFQKLKRKSFEDGFTLVELAIVVIIIGILTAIAIPVYNNQIAESIKSQVRSDVASTTARLKQWQVSQGYNADPPAVEKTKLIVKSDSATSVSIVSYTGASISDSDFCIQGSKSIKGTTYTYSYSTKTRSGKASACAAPTAPTVENYS